MKCEVPVCEAMCWAEGSSLIGQIITARPSHWPRVITHHFSQFRDVLWDKLASWRLECAMTGAESSYTILCYPSTYIAGHDIPFVIIFVITFCSSDCGPESESRWTIHHFWLHSRLLHRRTGTASRNTPTPANFQTYWEIFRILSTHVWCHQGLEQTMRQSDQSSDQPETELHSKKTDIHFSSFQFPINTCLEEKTE